MRASTLLLTMSTILTSVSADFPTFSVTLFSASGAPISVETAYSFSVTDGTSSANCSAVVSTLPGISFVPMTCCISSVADPACNWQFSFASATSPSGDAGFFLNITNIPAATIIDTGLAFFPAGDVETVTDPANPNGDFEFLNVPKSFAVPYANVFCAGCAA